MIGPLIALLLGGAQGVPPVQEAWTLSNLRLAPAVVVAAEAPEAPSRPAAEPAHGAAADAPAPAPAEPMPFQFERAVVRPAS